MNAASAPVPNPKAAEQRAHETSMEEILASIRKIIADDQVLPLTPRHTNGDHAEDSQRHREPAPAYEPRRAFEPPRERQQDRSTAAESRRAPETHRSEPEAPRPRPAAERPPLDFHSGLASIFANERPRIPRNDAPTGPQLVVSTPDPVVARAPTPDRFPPAPERREQVSAREQVSEYGESMSERRDFAAAPQVEAPQARVAAPRPAEPPVHARPVQEESSRHAAPAVHANYVDDETDDTAETVGLTQSGAAIVREIREAAVQNLRLRPAVTEDEPVPAPVAERAAPAHERQVETQRVELMDSLLSAETDASIASAFQALSSSVALPDDSLMESMTRDLLRPMLKQWLDDNLPVMVERLVRAEIERAARGGR